MYPGPLRDEPLAIELHNTLYAVGGEIVDGLDGWAEPWLAGLADRLPAAPGAWPAPDELVALRGAVRAALAAAAAGAPQDAAVLTALNRASARAPRSPAAHWHDGRVVAAIDHHG